ncbi:hypothetical protein RHSIM_Rhsim13G0124000 [Rhododendron simsii]|uniref:SOSEKI DIX-like domain-containing protein n=1 Tax=Rhododendron simsii TaxID=118357 RepID=A0A834FY73_RHOSS|nr:hypothetical protein RHSIM_Rhsim13G0124000 [Rhododendron simsii]
MPCGDGWRSSSGFTVRRFSICRAISEQQDPISISTSPPPNPGTNSSSKSQSGLLSFTEPSKPTTTSQPIDCRGYKNGFVWHNLFESDFIYLTSGKQYVLKGSELLDSAALISKSDESFSSNKSLTDMDVVDGLSELNIPIVVVCRDFGMYAGYAIYDLGLSELNIPIVVVCRDFGMYAGYAIDDLGHSMDLMDLLISILGGFVLEDWRTRNGLECRCLGDAAISIAMLHHLSTESRRKKAIDELIRVVKKGGFVLIIDGYVEEWIGPSDPCMRNPPSLTLESIPEAEENSMGKNIMDTSLIAKLPKLCMQLLEAKLVELRLALLQMGWGKIDDKKSAVVYNRYYHVFSEVSLKDWYLTRVTQLLFLSNQTGALFLRRQYEVLDLLNQPIQLKSLCKMVHCFKARPLAM